jgi:hypothetical protein
MYILYNQRDATYTMFFIIISAVHVSGGFSAHHQELIKLYVQLWVLSCFPAVYRRCGWVGTTALSCSSILVLLESCLQTCMAYVQWINSWWWTDELAETCRVSWQNKFVKFVYLIGFVTKKICSDARSHEREVLNRHLNFTPNCTCFR